MKRNLILTILIIGLSACQPIQQKSWYKEGATQQDFAMDMGQCRAQAFSISGGSLLQIAIVQNACMQGKGWSLQQQMNAVSADSAPAVVTNSSEGCILDEGKVVYPLDKVLYCSKEHLNLAAIASGVSPPNRTGHGCVLEKGDVILPLSLLLYCDPGHIRR